MTFLFFLPSQPKTHLISRFYYQKSAETTSFDLRSSLSHIIQQTPGLPWVAVEGVLIYEQPQDPQQLTEKAHKA